MLRLCVADVVFFLTVDLIMLLNPKESGEFIVKHAQHVQVHEMGIKNLAHQIVEAILDGSLSVNNFSQFEFHPKADDKNALNWLFVLDTLNFCFWTNEDNEKWTVEGQTGYFALCQSIKRAIRNSIDITNPEFFSTITQDKLEEIMKSDNSTPVPLIKERVACLHEVGKKLIEKYNGNFKNVVKASDGSASKLLALIVEEFPCFRDEAVFHRQKVSLYKRAQILIGDVYAHSKGEGIGSFEDLSQTITMFADYRVPQVLVHFGAMTYKPELLNDLKENKILLNGEEKEVEIRGASIYIVEQAKAKVLEYLKADHPEVSLTHVNSILIDHFLWDYRRMHAEYLTYIPFHKTLSVYY